MVSLGLQVPNCPPRPPGTVQAHTHHHSLSLAVNGLLLAQSPPNSETSKGLRLHGGHVWDR